MNGSPSWKARNMKIETNRKPRITHTGLLKPKISFRQLIRNCCQARRSWPSALVPEAPLHFEEIIAKTRVGALQKTSLLSKAEAKLLLEQYGGEGNGLWHGVRAQAAIRGVNSDKIIFLILQTALRPHSDFLPARL
ncbi:unnamed protein product [Larinioides sclopetarius]|uniref:Cation-transporting P-type ATPase N-terminal domain-containing protein n=1 Tax=Larinioides sclopetarius TaxID=280406 RepID=A0AAV1YQJ3_9ARAC